MDWPAIEFQSSFATWDWVIVAAVAAVVLGVGLYAKRYVTDLKDFLVAGRSIRAELGVTSLVATELGLAATLCAAQLGFERGFAAFHVALAAFLAAMFVGLSGFVVAPLRKMRVATIPQFYGRRFGPGVRVAGGAILAAAGVLKMGVFLQLVCLFLVGLTGLADPLSIKLIVTALLLSAVLYTATGGMVASILTDYLQFVAMALALLLACLAAIQTPGLDLDSAVPVVESVRGAAGFDPFHPDGFAAAGVVWGVFLALGASALWQPNVSRALAARSSVVARQTYALASIGFLIRWLVPCFLGVCALVYFHKPKPVAHPSAWTPGPAWLAELDQPKPLCEPALCEQFPPTATGNRALLAMPVFLSQVLPSGLIGLIAAGLIAAFLSTQDSWLLAWSSVLAQDVVAPCLRRDLSDRARLRLTRLLLVLLAAGLLLCGLWVPLARSLWSCLVVAASVYFAGAFSLLVLGLYWRRASRAGAYLALGCSLLALFGLEPLRRAVGLEVSEGAVGLAACGLSVVGMVVGSLLVPDRGRPWAPPREADDEEEQ